MSEFRLYDPFLEIFHLFEKMIELASLPIRKLRFRAEVMKISVEVVD